MKPTFILGLGAPKSGTTWLYRYINALPVSNLGIRKEYRVLNARVSVDPAKRRVGLGKIFANRLGPIPMPCYAEIIRLPMLRIDGFYEWYFRRLISGAMWMTADISPGYMTMTEDQLEAAAERLKRAGFDVKVVFLMRDPFERCWSGARMRKRNGLEPFSSQTDEQNLKAILEDENVVARTRYELTVAAVDAVFSEDAVFYGFYETLFSKQEIQRLSDFLGVKPDFSMLDAHYNKSPKTEKIGEDLVSHATDIFRETYAFCNTRFPVTTEIWH
ncbi:sulfotransferase [Pseudoruegeria sp. HB172150]|uniref:sulfotransferase n=1 Tax=Pseudoruegeria sp. HB172150 TaxID=2721164 RepID=UPI001552428C|nr:sulfotransferase [Pseudoruegeria sp. HB172150]